MLELKNVRFSYKSKAPVIENVSLHVETKESIGILGHNGAGKTTMLKIILGLLKPQMGQVIMDNTNGNKNFISRGFVSYMPEDSGIYEKISALENLYFRAKISKVENTKIHDETIYLLEKLQLADRAKEIVGTWSNGMKKRLSLACAIINHPKLLLLDEPTNGLDPESLDIITNLLKELNNLGTTILINSHDLNTVKELCRRIVVLQKGKIIFDGEISIENDSLRQFYLDLTKSNLKEIE